MIDPKHIKLINAWKIAAEKLGLEIVTPFVVNTENGKAEYPVLIKHFGRKIGTVIASHHDFMDIGMPKDPGYYFSAVNHSVYLEYNQEEFITALTDWGYFGNPSDKPDWYQGHVYSDSTSK